MPRTTANDGWYDNPNVRCETIIGLNMSDGGNNNNKYYNCEILEFNGNYRVYSTYGRVGKSGQIFMESFGSLGMARSFYESKVGEKVKKGYLKVDLVGIDECSTAGKQIINKQSVPTQVTTVATPTASTTKPSARKKSIQIDPEVQQLVELIYYEANRAISSTLTTGRVNSANKSPLGALGIHGINQGRRILQEIGQLLNNRSGIQDIVMLSNQYNSYIPRIMPSNMRTDQSWLLNNRQKLEDQLDLLDLYESALGMVEVLSDQADLGSRYKALKADIKHVTDAKTMEYIRHKIDTSYAPNHRFRAKVTRAFEINQKNAPKFDDSVGNVRHLFHGTRNANLMGILSSHLKVPAHLGKDIVVTGRMFGDGIYFASESSKSLNYSRANFGGSQNKSNKVFLFICEVALGNVHYCTRATHFMRAPQGYHSVMGVGERTLQNMIARGEMPSGTGTSLINNEFIIYNQARQRIKYLVELEMN